MQSKICGIKDVKSLKYIINHKHPPNFIGFICNYPKSKRFVRLKFLKNLFYINRKNINFVSVLVSPKEKILEKIKNFNFQYYQLYDVTPKETLRIKKKYKKKLLLLSLLKIK